MDLTGYTDEELEALRHETAVEQTKRLRLVQITQNIAGLTHELLDGGGTVQQAQDAVLDGQAAKEQADADAQAAADAEAAAEAERQRIEAERPTISVSPEAIPADGTTTAVVTYTDPGVETTPDVTFTVNGVAETVALTDGVATLDVVSTTPGDTITVTVDTLPGQSVTVAVEGA